MSDDGGVLELEARKVWVLAVWRTGVVEVPDPILVVEPEARDCPSTMTYPLLALAVMVCEPITRAGNPMNPVPIRELLRTFVSVALLPAFRSSNTDLEFVRLRVTEEPRETVCLTGMMNEDLELPVVDCVLGTRPSAVWDAMDVLIPCVRTVPTFGDSRLEPSARVPVLWVVFATVARV